MEKVLLITGATSTVAMKLLRGIYTDYKRIYLHFRTENEEFQKLVDALSPKADIVLLKADLSMLPEVEGMIEQIKETGILPNCIVHFPAPKAYNLQFHKDVWSNYEKGWDISVRSIVVILQAFMKNMSREHYGRIIFMLTSCTNNLPPKYQASYVTVKYALLGLMKSLSVEYADKGTTVNGVSPDMMETKFLSNLPQLIVDQNKANSPLGRNIYVEEVIPIMKHMLSDLGASMTGQNIVISGGM